MKTMIAIPCMGELSTRFAGCLMSMKRPGEATVYMESQSLIYDARNRLAQTAIKKGFDRVLWLDSDMVFEPDLMERLSARIDEGRDFVTGVYVQRKSRHEPTIYSEWRTEELEDGKLKAKLKVCQEIPEEIFEIEACGFGIAMTTVKMLQDIMEQKGLPFTPVPGFGEDIACCMRARELGYKIWCDGSIQAGHEGTYVYKLEDWAR